MATKKPKSSAKPKAKTTTKPKTTAAKTVEKPVSEATKTKTVDKVETTKGKSCLSGFFAKKYEEKESILTIFKCHKFYGALLGEIIGTGLLTMLVFMLSFAGLANIGTFAWAPIAILIAIFAFSGACLNPVVVVGMVASRRMSVIRGVMYIIAEIIGAWLGWLILNSFRLAGGESAAELSKMVETGENFWVFAMLELFGGILVAFFFARALKYKRSVFTFAVTAVGGLVFAYFTAYLISYAFVGVQGGNYLFNPAIALMYQIFPTAGEGFGEIMGGICQALTIYALFPIVGGVAGFYLSDFMGKLSSEE